MNTNGAVSVLGFTPKYRTLLASLIVLAAAIPYASASTVILDTHLDTTGATPFSIWAAAGLVGLGLFLLTLKARTLTSELEADAIMSVLAWIPIAFTAYTSFKVDRIVGVFAVASSEGYTLMEDHLIYHFDIIGILYGIFLLVAIINTIRIVSLHKALVLTSDDGRGYSSGSDD